MNIERALFQKHKYFFSLDELKVILSVNQNSKTIENRNIFLGMCELKATINELSHYLRGAKTEYYWILNDVKVVKEKTLINHVKHNFTKEGNFLVEVSASVTKNGMVYIGHGSIHVETKGILTIFFLIFLVKIFRINGSSQKSSVLN